MSALFDLMTHQWFWIVLFIFVGLVFVAKEIAKTASNPYVRVGAKGIWSLFK